MWENKGEGRVEDGERERKRVSGEGLRKGWEIVKEVNGGEMVKGTKGGG